MSQTPNTAMAVIGIDIGKNSFHVVGHDARGAIASTALRIHCQRGNDFCSICDSSLWTDWMKPLADSGWFCGVSAPRCARRRTIMGALISHPGGYWPNWATR
jgi:hypothetical protein